MMMPLLPPPPGLLPPPVLLPPQAVNTVLARLVIGRVLHQLPQVLPPQVVLPEAVLPEAVQEVQVEVVAWCLIHEFE